jgi:L,D-peptidoglycan transpeptidase YkuD (ErfK/YbiS/YcfS/YnhG family)
MHLYLLLLHLFLSLLPARPLAGAESPAKPTLVVQPLQAVVVLTRNWNSVPATLQRFERARVGTPWKPVGPPLPAVVGRNGLGWGIGLYAGPSPARGPVKKEGDGRAPAGVFRLSSAFGYAPAAANDWIKLPYLHATKTIQCVDDPQSEHYNQLVDTTRQAATWGSYENMLLQDDQYRLGVVVDHNAAPAQAGAGSCIFVHIWKNAETGTSGCTALAAGDVETLLRWLDPAKHPVLAQFPQAQYQKIRLEWGLPAFAPEKPASAP